MRTAYRIFLNVLHISFFILVQNKRQKNWSETTKISPNKKQEKVHMQINTLTTSPQKRDLTVTSRKLSLSRGWSRAPVRDYIFLDNSQGLSSPLRGILSTSPTFTFPRSLLRTHQHQHKGCKITFSSWLDTKARTAEMFSMKIV